MKEISQLEDYHYALKVDLDVLEGKLVDKMDAMESRFSKKVSHFVTRGDLARIEEHVRDLTISNVRSSTLMECIGRDVADSKSDISLIKETLRQKFFLREFFLRYPKLASSAFVFIILIVLLLDFKFDNKVFNYMKHYTETRYGT